MPKIDLLKEYLKKNENPRYSLSHDAYTIFHLLNDCELKREHFIYDTIIMCGENEDFRIQFPTYNIDMESNKCGYFTIILYDKRAKVTEFFQIKNTSLFIGFEGFYDVYVRKSTFK